MAEHRLYPEGTVPPVSTFEFHEHRERAPHLEQPVHRPRLDKALEFVLDANKRLYQERGFEAGVTDLGCGDGGLLSLMRDHDITARGYDFQPSNAAGWAERKVDAQACDVFGADRHRIIFGEIAVATEVLEHLADPHEAVRFIGQMSRYLVASSPWNESPESHDACHSWCWDQDGYRALIEQGGFEVLRHETVGQFQVILGERR